MKNVFMLITAILLTVNGTSQILNNVNEKHISPFQLSFIYPLGTNGINSINYKNNFSLNLFIGINGGVEGIEIGNFLNINTDDVSGIQLSGFSNINREDLNGLQIAGFSNINKGEARGIQIAGFLSYNEYSHELIQLSGFSNFTNHINGIQAAGFINMTNVSSMKIPLDKNEESDKLVQLAGFANIARNIKGIQGAGFMNIAGKVEGIQIAGFINICDSIDGIPIGFINYVKKNGYRKLAIWSSETFYLNTSYKIGVEKFYTIFSLGYKPNSRFFDWSPGVGFGTALNLKNNNYADIEWVYHYLPDENIWNEDYVSHYNDYSQVKINFRRQITGNIGVFGGPSFNFFNTQHYNSFAPSWALNYKFRYYNDFYFWIGFNAGLQF